MKRNYLIAICCFILFNSCTNNTPKNEIHLGYLPITADVPLFVAIEKGLFKNRGLNVIADRFINSNDVMDPLISGKIDGAVMIGYSTLISIFEKDSRIFKIIQSGVENDSNFTSRILVLKNSRIKKIEDLKGKTIGTYTGLTQKLNLILILNKFFEKPEREVKIIQVEPNLQIPALISGQIDALFTIDPHSTIVIEKNIGRTISDGPRSKYIINPFPTCATVLSTKIINEKPEVARKIISALDEAIDWIDKNKEEAYKLMSESKYVDMSIDICISCGTYKWWKAGRENVEAVQKLANIMYDYKLIDTKMIVDNMFLKNGL